MITHQTNRDQNIIYKQRELASTKGNKKAKKAH
jgi:hypothetical protein